MQRSLSRQNHLSLLLFPVLYLVYASLGSIYLLLPPLLGLLFIRFIDSLQQEHLYALLSIGMMLLIFEAEKGYIFLSTLLFFMMMTHLVIPFLQQHIVCKACLDFFYITLAYLGYYVTMQLIAHIFLFELPSFDALIPFYIVVEFLLVMLLL